MKRIVTTLALLLAAACLYAQQIRDVDVKVVVYADGSAHVTQQWDVDVVSGTEWYIPIENLGPMRISNLRVSENGRNFTSLGDDWDTSLSRTDKAGKCGIVRKSDGVELCWGQGEYGSHVWTAEFDMTGLVQGMNDYDGFNFMFVNDEMIAGPQHAKVTIINATEGAEWTSENVKIWAFGYSGEVYLDDGAIVAETDEAMSRSHHMIVLARFDKGMLSPAVTRDYSFEKMEKKAKKGSDYKDDEGNGGVIFLTICGLLAAVWYARQKKSGKVFSKKMFGTNKIEGWVRDVPLNGDLLASFYVFNQGGRFSKGTYNQNLIGAYFLKWVLEHKVTPVPNEKSEKRLNLAFDPNVVLEEPVEARLYDMALEAAGSNGILEDREFERWAKRNYSTVCSWPSSASIAGHNSLIRQGIISRVGQVSPDKYEETQAVIKFRNFLKDFTIINERGTAEVALWNNYLVYAQLYGIADKVAEQLKKLFPADFQQYAQGYNMTSDTFTRTILLNNYMASTAFTGASAAAAARNSGGGGRASFGGGGGFSGGGHGGGSR